MVKSIIKFNLILIILLTTYSNTFAVNTSEVFKKYNIKYQDQKEEANDADLQYVQRLPDQDYKTFTSSVVRLVLGFVATLCFISISVAGVMFVLSEADSELQTKAKSILKYSVYGIIVIGLSYSVIYGIARLDFD